MTQSTVRRYLKDPASYDPSSFPRPMPESPEPPESPCVGVCTMDDEGHCIGCFRTLDEIAQWGTLSPEEQWRVVEELPARDPQANSGS
ncbi:putative Fe-S protein YdhL (DUF1289 family) [Natronospira proteinivora]|uniref:Fe-S protein YdhL (DUF1289 family) n=1 Tax=Natronospira proteinivora TaxID=1807133 RepID=A0ABT1G4L8_9GAMM|nr:DUF1289 domain-containing protein [Natronospira proteinivora]MCP1726239.1 putative Fe-S protein YdhL (DUF1289 family) [Natronospira proteinivora]